MIQAAVYAGFKAEQIEVEHSGGLDDGRPGDVMIYNFEPGRHLLIDVCVVNPLATSYRDLLSKPGAVATALQKRKVRKYEKKGLRAGPDEEYRFCPFLIETTGGFGEEAEKLCNELRKIRRARNINAMPENARQEERDQLKEAISVELQRQNAASILEREPPPLNATIAATDELEEIAEAAARQAIAAARADDQDPDIIAQALFREGTEEVHDSRLLQQNPPPPTPPPPPPAAENPSGMAIQNSQVPSLPNGLSTVESHEEERIPPSMEDEKSPIPQPPAATPSSGRAITTIVSSLPVGRASAFPPLPHFTNPYTKKSYGNNINRPP